MNDDHEDSKCAKFVAFSEADLTPLVGRGLHDY